jgi:formylglycine-generating enzyme required for sulfatase activity
VLVASYSPIDDLTPLQGTAITELNLDHCTPLADLTPLKGMPLEKLNIQGCDKIVDVTPLKELPLKEIICDFKPARDAEVLRAIKTLVTINGKPAAEFWKGQEKAPAEKPLAKTFTNSLGMEFVLVPKGKSWLGGGNGKAGDKEVEIINDFYLGKYEVTQEEWQKVTGSNPSRFKTVPGVAKEDQKRFPVEDVSWDDAQMFLKLLNAQAKETGWMYRLPREAEWEYACRGGPLTDKADSTFDFYFEKPTNQLLPEQANFEHANGLKRPCKVWEWCDDEIRADSKEPKRASQRMIRGGG